MSSSSAQHQDGALPDELPFIKAGAKQPGAQRQTHFKRLKQMLTHDVEVTAAERMAQDGAEDYTPWCSYSAFEAGPSLLPPKKYSDVSGLEAAYTDPRTGLRYASVAELKVIRTMSPAQVEQMLQLRGAGQSVG